MNMYPCFSQCQSISGLICSHILNAKTTNIWIGMALKECRSLNFDEDKLCVYFVLKLTDY